MATEKIFHLLNEPRQIFMERGGRGLAEARQGDKDSRPPPFCSLNKIKREEKKESAQFRWVFLF
jgi:hypothetical protein